MEIKELLALLLQKKDFLSTFEVLSESLLHSDIEAMELIVDQRDDVINQTNEVNHHIEQIIITSECKEDLQDAIQTSGYRCDVKAEFLPIFDMAQEVFAVINRIANIEPRIAKHLEQSLFELERKLKETNTLPKINRYLDTLSTELEDGSLISSAAQKV